MQAGERTNRARATASASAPATVARRCVLVEKNLAAMGFFTPSSNRIKRAKAKTIHSSQLVDGQRVDVSATIVPSALHGLPITADQDKYLALQELFRAQLQATGIIANPVTFSTAALLRSFDIYGDSGKNQLILSSHHIPNSIVEDDAQQRVVDGEIAADLARRSR